MRFLLALLTTTTTICPALPAQDAAGPATVARRIEVRISLARLDFVLGQPVEMAVELVNTGEQPAFVGRRLLGTRFQSFPYNFEILLRNSEGQELPRSFMHVECLPFRKEDFSVEDFQEIILRDWIVLHPGEAFRTKLSFDLNFGAAPVKPGRYQIRGIYSASGLEYQTHCNWLPLMKDALKKLPYKSFTGRVESNEIWVTIRNK